MIIHVIMSAIIIATIFFYAWYNNLSWRNEIKTILMVFAVAILVPFLPVAAGFFRLVKDIANGFKRIKEQSK
jgi:hypothetical protein